MQIVAFLLLMLFTNNSNGGDMSPNAPNNNQDIHAIKEFSVRTVYWGGLRVNTITLSKDSNKVTLFVSSEFDRESSGKHKQIQLPDSVWDHALDIVKRSQQGVEHKNKSVDPPPKRDVVTQLSINEGFRKPWKGINRGEELLNYLCNLAAAHTDILEK